MSKQKLEEEYNSGEDEDLQAYLESEARINPPRIAPGEEPFQVIQNEYVDDDYVNYFDDDGIEQYIPFQKKWLKSKRFNPSKRLLYEMKFDDYDRRRLTAKERWALLKRKAKVEGKLRVHLKKYPPRPYTKWYN